MSYFVCQHCQKINHVFGKKKPENEENKIETEVLGMAPMNNRMYCTVFLNLMYYKDFIIS